MVRACCRYPPAALPLEDCGLPLQTLPPLLAPAVLPLRPASATASMRRRMRACLSSGMILGLESQLSTVFLLT